MAEGERLGASFSIDVTDLKTGLLQANRLIRESESEFKNAAAGLDDWTTSEEGLNAKIKSLNDITEVQKKKVSALKSEYKRLIDDGLDPTSKQAVELRTKINNEETALKQNESELKKQKEALKNVGKESKDAGEETKNFGEIAKTAGKAAATAFAAVATAAAGAVTSLLGLAESTRESRENMAKLETGFTTAGLSAEDAAETYKSMYGILGDDGQATEASAHLAQLANNQEDLAKWTDIATGVYATFGDSLPIEGLTEAANETAKTGELTGALADALNWATDDGEMFGLTLKENIEFTELSAKELSKLTDAQKEEYKERKKQYEEIEAYNQSIEEAVSAEDKFKIALANCSDEQERQALITDTLNGLYDEASEKYKEVNKDIIESQEAQAELNDALNELGKIAEPIMTTLKTLSAELLTTITPFVSLIGEGLQGALNGTADSSDKLAEGLSGVIDAVLDVAKEIVPTILNVVLELIPAIVQTLTEMFPSIVETILSMLPTLLDTTVQVIVSIVEMIASMIPTIIDSIMEILPVLIQSLIDAIPQLLEAAIQLLSAIVYAIPTIITMLISQLPTIVNSIISTLLDNLPMLLDAAVTLFLALVDAIPLIIQQLNSEIPTIIASIIKGLIKGIPQLIEAGAKMLDGIFTGLINPKVIWESVKSLFNGIIGGIKELFGIHSPSTVMENIIGKNLALGIGKGFDENIGEVNDEIADAMNFGNVNVNATGTANAGSVSGAGGVVVYQTNNYSQAHSRYELYKSKQQTAAAVRLALSGV